MCKAGWFLSSFGSSIVVIPGGAPRRIETFPVFCVPMIFSVFAYIWLLIILVVHSPDKVEVWEAAVALSRAGMPVQAVTLWSLFGAVDWNSLLLRRDAPLAPPRCWHRRALLAHVLTAFAHVKPTPII